MSWIRVDAYHWRHESGRYTVDAAIVPSSKTGMRHCAWFKQHEDTAPELLGCYDFPQPAMRLCTIHLSEHGAHEDQPLEQAALAL